MTPIHAAMLGRAAAGVSAPLGDDVTPGASAVNGYAGDRTVASLEVAVAALELDRMTWPEVHAAQQAGRDLLVIAFGATEQHGFRRLVLLPTHGGNFAPLAAALEQLGPIDGIEVRALTDISALLALAQLGVDEYGVPLGDGGLHAGDGSPDRA